MRRRKQFDALAYARGAARVRSYARCEAWVERAAKLWPLSPMQWHNLRLIMENNEHFERMQFQITGLNQEEVDANSRR